MSRIPLTFIDNVAYTFNADDYMKLRCEHRVIGKLVGCSVKWPRNINVAGLPAAYSTYETQLLLDKGIVVLVQKQFPETMSPDSVEAYKNLQTSHQSDLTEYFREKKIAESKKVMDKILVGKRKKVEAMGGDVRQVTEESMIADIIEKFKPNLGNILVQVPTEEAFETITKEVICPYPSLNQLKYRAFCDLWEKGKWLSSGETFGGDFLIYPGEPMYFHASHIVHVLDETEAKEISPISLIRKGRLSVAVNKFCILAYVNPVNNELSYQTVQWQGK